MARNSLLCADVPLRNYSLTHSLPDHFQIPCLFQVTRSEMACISSVSMPRIHVSMLVNCVLLEWCMADILGDGTVHPWQLIRAPAWVKGYRGNELQRTASQLKIQGRFLREMFPSKHHTLMKNLFYQFNKMNKRQHTRYWGGYRRFSRIDKPKLRY